jgi:hypothetical protein
MVDKGLLGPGLLLGDICSLMVVDLLECGLFLVLVKLQLFSALLQLGQLNFLFVLLLH